MDNKKTIRNLLIYLGIPIVLIIIISLLFFMQPKEEYPTSDIVYMFQNQQVDEYNLDFGTGALELKLNTEYKGKKELKTNVASISLFLNTIEDYVKDYNKDHADAPMKFNWKQASDNSWWLNFLPNLILIGLLAVVWIYFMRRISGGLGDAGKQMGFGKAKIKNLSDEKRKTTFADVAGADEEKEELREIVELSRCKNTEGRSSCRPSRNR